MKEKLSTYYRILIVLISGYGLYINFKLVSFRYGILYFTNISNLLCFAYFLLILIKTFTNRLKKQDSYYIAKGMVTMAIALTMIVYNSCLSINDSINVFAGHDLETNIVHIVVPVLVICDYLIFEEKGHLKKTYPLIWSSILLLYLAFSYVYIGMGGRFIDNAKYPYPFMDVSELGVFGVVVNIFVILTLYIGFGSLIQFLDSKPKK